MKYLFALCCVLAVAVCEKYTSKYDNVDIQEILHNKRLFSKYLDCIMDRGKCPPDGKELKDHLQEAIETGCEKCTEAQENGATTIIEFLIKNEQAAWRELCEKFDPERKWRKKYEDRARAKGIVIPE